MAWYDGLTEEEVIKKRIEIQNIGAIKSMLFTYYSPEKCGKLPWQDMYIKLKLQQYKCQYCKQEISVYIAHLDHVIPASRNGYHSCHNVVWTCSNCNMSKNKSSLLHFCKRHGFDYEQIMQEIADINYEMDKQVGLIF